MSGPSTASAGDPVAGWTLLAERQWSEARDAFAHALAAEETPEALEGLSWAAWWLDDADAVFHARERAFQLYRRQRRPADAARMATWIAADQLDFRGAFAVARGWLRRARRLLDPLDPGPEHGWLAFHEGYIANLEGDAARAAALATRTAELGREFSVPDLEMLGLALQGSVLVARSDIEAGMALLDEAAASALGGDATIPISRAWTCCFLVSACESVRDFGRAFEWCDRIAEFAERYGSRYMLGFCRAHYGTVHVWRGDWVEAEAALQGAIVAYTRSRPPYVSEVVIVLAELRRRQGRWDEAEQLLDDAGATALLCRAHLALDRGETLRAAELAERLLRRNTEPRQLREAPPLELIVCARVQRGELEEAEQALARLRDVERLVGTLPIRAAVAHAEGLLATARGRQEHARRHFEDAVDLFTLAGVPFEAARARIELASCLRSMGRADGAEREARAALDELNRLGATAEAHRARRFLDTSAAVAVPSGATTAALTRREREVLQLVAQGLSNRLIGEQLFISEHTVHRHVTSILRKLGVPTRAAAAALAASAGLLAGQSDPVRRTPEA